MDIPGSSRLSLYTTLAAIIVATVVTVLSVHSTAVYFQRRDVIVQEMDDSARRSLATLEKSVSSLMAAYSVHEYDLLVQSGMEREDILAILVDDYNMGRILGEAAYTTGRLRISQDAIVDYDPGDAQHRALLAQTGQHVHRQPIHDAANHQIGMISIYMSDAALKREFNRVISEALTHTLQVSLLLIVALFVAIRLIAIKPLSAIVEALRETDEDGIPRGDIPRGGSRELLVLSGTIQRMVRSVRDSRTALAEQRDRLQSIIDGIDDPIMVIAPDYSVMLMNTATRTMAGNPRLSDAKRPRCYEVNHRRSTPCDGEDHPCPLHQVLNTGQPGVVVHRHGEHYVELAATPLYDSHHRSIGVIEVARDITEHLRAQNELRRQKDTLRHQATHDALTGLANRILFDDRLREGIKRSERNHTGLALLFIDLDHFKEVNDSLGHKVGDLVLNTVARRFQEAMRDQDTLARLGGDEFAVMIEGLHQPRDASILATKLLEQAARPLTIEGREIYVGSSIGISLYPDNGETPEDLLKHADAAMYRAKAEGRNNFQYYSMEMTDLAFQRLSIETGLRNALRDGNLEVHYQPQVDGRTRRLIGVEALVRWNDPESGLVMPDRFIPIAEGSGLIVDIDRYVMREAMTQLAGWHRKGVAPERLAVNCSTKHLQQEDFLDRLLRLLDDTGCEPQWLELEVTESQIMTRPERIIETLEQLAAKGISLALDDFGTGYSSLSHLKKLPITRLKIDRTFIGDLPDDEEDAGITRAIVALAHSLGIDLVAEGVKTDEQREFLLNNGCNVMQGYLYARPMPAVEMERLLHKGFRVPAKARAAGV